MAANFAAKGEVVTEARRQYLWSNQPTKNRAKRVLCVNRMTLAV
jgi:hypothetical protein